MRKYIALLLLCCSVPYGAKCHESDDFYMAAEVLDAIACEYMAFRVADKISDPSASYISRAAWTMLSAAAQGAIGHFTYGQIERGVYPKALMSFFVAFNSCLCYTVAIPFLKRNADDYEALNNNVDLSALDAYLDSLLYTSKLKDNDTLQKLCNEYVTSYKECDVYQKRLRQLQDEERDLKQRYNEYANDPVLVTNVESDMSFQRVHDLMYHYRHVQDMMNWINDRLRQIAEEKQDAEQNKKRYKDKLDTCTYYLSYFTDQSHIDALARAYLDRDYAYNNDYKASKELRMTYMPYLTRVLLYASKFAGATHAIMGSE